MQGSPCGYYRRPLRVMWQPLQGVEERKCPDLHFTRLTLADGLRINYRKTRAEAIQKRDNRRLLSSLRLDILFGDGKNLARV